MTTEQIIILGFLAAAFVAGWAARAVVGGGRRVEVGSAPLAQRFEAAARHSRDELARAIRAYHAAVVRSLRNGEDATGSGDGTLESLAGALVALSRAVNQAARELEPQHPLTRRLHVTGLELRRLADDVTRHSRERRLPSGVFDQLEQHLISTASIIFTSDRPQPRAI